jgi:hypothetical protein
MYRSQRNPGPQHCEVTDKMPVRRRTDKRRNALTPHEDAWLRGDRDGGFVQFKRDEELQALWDAYGDHDAFFWEPPMNFPDRQVNTKTKNGRTHPDWPR